MGAHSTAATESGKTWRLHVCEGVAEHTASKARQVRVLATGSSEAWLAGRPSRRTTKLSKTTEASKSTVWSGAARLAAIVAHRTLGTDMSTKVGKRTQTTKARLVHGVATKSKTWKRCAWNVRGTVFQCFTILLGAVLRRLIGVGVGRALRVVASRATRASGCLLVGLQEARSKSTSIVRCHAKGTEAKVTITCA
jgi:hypothetical protein